MSKSPSTINLQRSLCAALRARDLTKVVEFLEAGAVSDWYSPDIESFTPMEEAVVNDFLPGLEALHAAGGDVNFPGYQGETPLMNAASVDAIKAGRWLLSHGANEKTVSHRQRTALTEALRNCNLEFADMLLEERPALRDNSLYDTAERAIEYTNVDVARWLLKNGASPDTKSVDDTPWIAVAITKAGPVRHQLMDLLFQAGVDINQATKEGKTAAHCAVEKCQADDLLWLLRAGADPDKKDVLGVSARQMAEMQGDDSEVCHALRAWEASREAEKILNNVADTCSPL